MPGPATPGAASRIFSYLHRNPNRTPIRVQPAKRAKPCVLDRQFGWEDGTETAHEPAESPAAQPADKPIE